MKLSTLKLSLIPLFLLSRQGFGQAGLAGEGSSIGDIRQPLSARELDRLDQKGLLPLIVEEPTEDAPIEIGEQRSFEFTHANGYRQAAKEVGQLTEAGLIESTYDDPRRITRRKLSWDLGLSDEYSALGQANLREERLWGNHRPRLELSLLGRAFKGSGATLDEIYQGAYRLGEDFDDYLPADSVRTEGGVRLGDTLRIGQRSSLTLEAEVKEDRYELDDALTDASTYQAISLTSVAAVSRDSQLLTTLRRSLIRYEDERNNFDQSQAINEAQTVLLSRISPLYSAGVGFRTLDGTRNGPVLALIRRPDERSEAEARVSYLKGEGDDQILGSFRAKHKITRLLSFTLNLEQNIDLLSAYSSLSVSGRTNVRQQRISKAYDMAWIYTGKRAVSSLSLIANRQDYAAASLTQKEVRLQIDTPLTSLDTLSLLSSLRHFTEDGEVLRPVDRRQSLIEGSWRHFWGMDTRLFGARHFGELGVAQERLWEGSQERTRSIFRIALGQEWK